MGSGLKQGVSALRMITFSLALRGATVMYMFKQCSYICGIMRVFVNQLVLGSTYGNSHYRTIQM